MKRELFLADHFNRLYATNLLLNKKNKIKGDVARSMNYALPRGLVYYMPQMKVYAVPLYTLAPKGSKIACWVTWKRMDKEARLLVVPTGKMKTRAMTRLSSADYFASMVMRDQKALDAHNLTDEKRLMHMVNHLQAMLEKINVPATRNSGFDEAGDGDTPGAGLSWLVEGFMFADDSTLQLTPEGVRRVNEVSERIEDMARLGKSPQTGALKMESMTVGHA